MQSLKKRQEERWPDLRAMMKGWPLKMGGAEVMHFEINKRHKFEMMHGIFNGDRYAYTHPGTYTRLVVDKKLVMSDTRMERVTNYEFMSKAHGRVMVAGLGLGLILPYVLWKNEVTQVLAYEKSRDVIDLIEQPLRKYVGKEAAKKLTIVQADILKQQRNLKATKWDTIYFDIWSERCDDNLEQMKKLHTYWKYRKAKGGWMGSWYQKELHALRSQESRRARRW